MPLYEYGCTNGHRIEADVKLDGRGTPEVCTHEVDVGVGDEGPVMVLGSRTMVGRSSLACPVNRGPVGSPAVTIAASESTELASRPSSARASTAS